MKLKKNGFVNYILNRLICDEEILKEKFAVIDYGNELEDEVYKYRRKKLKLYIVVICATVFITIISVVFSYFPGNEIQAISREGVEKNENINIPVEVKAEFNGSSVKEKIDLSIMPRKLSEKEVKKVIHEYGKTIEEKFFYKDEKGNIIASQNLKLPDSDSEYGIQINWESSDPVLISEIGEVNVTSLAGESEVVILSAELSLEGISQIFEYQVLVRDDQNLYEESLEREINEIVDNIENNVEDPVIKLPDKAGNGVVLKWYRSSRTYSGVVFCSGMLILVFMHIRRYGGADKISSEYRESVCRDFPEIPERLILLLDSGMTAYSALMRISDDYEKQYCNENIRKRSEKWSIRPIAREVAEIGRRVNFTNSSIVSEWKALAARMQSGEMLRFCTILEDNMTKGSEMSVKLDIECRNLRETRKKEIQKNIRVIDSKMMFPMMIMLFSLIMVAVAPALMEF